MPLNGIKVLDVATFIAGPYCATILAEFGADVIKVEHPTHGDPLRKMGTLVEGGETLTWLSEARNKSTLTLDLGKPEGAELFRRMVENVDVVVENFRPGTMEKWGLGYEALSAINKKLVMVRVSGFGQEGPYKNRPGFARIAHAYGGLSYLSGKPDDTPVVPGSTSLADYIAGLYSAIGTLLAIRDVERTGLGQVVDVALYEAVFRLLDEVAPAYAKLGTVRQRLGADAPTLAPHSHYQCSDGHWIALACSSNKLFGKLTQVMDRADLLDDPRFNAMHMRVEHKDALNEIVSAWIKSFTREAFLQLCLDHEIPASPINSVADLFADAHFQHRQSVKTLTDDEAGDITIPNVMPRLSRSPGQITHLGRKKGADTLEILKIRLGLKDDEINKLLNSGII